MHLTVSISVGDDPDPSEQSDAIAHYLETVAAEIRAGHACGAHEGRAWAVQETHG